MTPPRLIVFDRRTGAVLGGTDSYPAAYQAVADARAAGIAADIRKV